MKSLAEQIVEAWEDTPDWANETRAHVAIDLALEEMAKVAIGFDPALPERDSFELQGLAIGTAVIVQRQIAAAFRAMKGTL